MNGIDRIDNRLGYERANSIPCCSICNFAKNSMSYEDFIKWIGMVKKHKISSKIEYL
jgi:hypothetical protein